MQTHLDHRLLKCEQPLLRQALQFHQRPLPQNSVTNRLENFDFETIKARARPPKMQPPSATLRLLCQVASAVVTGLKFITAPIL